MVGRNSFLLGWPGELLLSGSICCIHELSKAKKCTHQKHLLSFLFCRSHGFHQCSIRCPSAISANVTNGTRLPVESGCWKLSAESGCELRSVFLVFRRTKTSDVSPKKGTTWSPFEIQWTHKNCNLTSSPYIAI